MATQEKSISEPTHEIRDGKLIIEMAGGMYHEISLEAIEHLLLFNAAKHCNNLVLSFAQISAQLLSNQSDFELKDLMGCTPSADDLYFVNLMGETFSKPPIKNE